MSGRTVLRVATVALGVLAAGGTGVHGSSAQEQRPAADFVVDKARFELLRPAEPPLTAEGTGAYRGAIEVVPSGGGFIVVNDVGVEDYVKGIVEVPSSWPAEAQKAQAIAARTYGLNRVQNPTPAPWGVAAHICPTDACQVYWGIRGEEREGGQNWIAAVNATAGQVLLYNGRPIFAQYSASNGGRSAAGSQPYLRSVPDPDDARTKLGHWQYSVPLSALAPLLGVQPPDTLTAVSRQGDAVVFTVRSPTPATTAPPTTQPLLPLAPTTTAAAPAPAPEASPATRQLSVPVGDFVSRANGGLPTPAGLPKALPSSQFTLRTSGDSVVIDGGGWGHGVGMSQYGALGKANRGMGAADILAAYYSGIRPSRPGGLPATIRVAIAPESGALTVSSPGLFRIVDGQGRTVVPVARGGWRATPAGGQVRITPPEDQRGPIVVDALTVDPSSPEVGAPPTVHFEVSSPALVAVRIVPPGAPAQDLPPQVVNSGPVSVPVPPGATDGDYHLFLTAAAGPGRQAGVPVRFVVGDPQEGSAPGVAVGGVVIPQSDGGGGGPSPALVVVAAALLGGDLLLARTARRRRQSALTPAPPEPSGSA
ncbi:MAG: SpoIID/LytB domain-containing protein [Actinomycetota bacterium]|nr:SpoIID/LytB domain-containing protein [Actinomycetota bacterium]